MNDTNLYERYCDELKDRSIQTSEDRWKSVLLFRRYLFRQQDVNEVTIHHALRKISDSFFKNEKQRFISRPNFFICLKERKYHIPSTVLCSIYYSFDVLKRGEFDWRAFLFMLHITCRSVNENVRDHLKYAFKFYTGNFDDIDVPCDYQIKLQNLCAVIEMLIRPDKVHSIIKLFDDGWNKISLAMALKNVGNNNVPIIPYISLRNFQMILEGTELLNNVNSDSELERFEREYYPTTLFKHRREKRVMIEFIVMCRVKKKTEIFNEWRRTSKRMKRIHSILNSLSIRISFIVLSNAFSMLWNNTIRHLAAVGIQCAYSVYSAKVKATRKKIIKTSVIEIQKIGRGFIERQRFSIARQDRHNATVHIQRYIRGTLGRRVACNKKLTSIDMKQEQLKREKEEWHHCQTIKYAIKMQRILRRKSSQEAFRQALEKKQRELRVVKEMEEMLSKEEREQKIHTQQLKTHAEKSLYEWQTQQVVEEETAQMKDKVHNLHLRMKDKQRFEEEKQRQQRNVEYRKQMRHRLRKEWKQQEIEECQELLQHCLLCLRSPETPSERRRGKEIKKMIKSRYVYILTNSKPILSKRELNVPVFTLSYL